MPAPATKPDATPQLELNGNQNPSRFDAMQTLLPFANYRRVQMMTDARSFDTAGDIGTVFAGSGHIDYVSASSISESADIFGDRVDTDCDGLNQ